MYDISLNENGVTFKALEKIIYKYACKIACDVMKQALENLDKKLLEERDSKVYRNKGLKKTCIKTIMGDVEYSRRIYQYVLEDGRKVTKFLLDEYLGIDCIGKISMNLVETILTNVSEMSYRKVSSTVETMCNQNISPQGVWNVVQTVGTKIKEIEERKIELNEKGVLNGDKETEVLFQEQDGLWLSIQGKDKPKGKSKKKELKLAVSYTGWKKRAGNKNEYQVQDKTLCASFDTSKHFKKLVAATVAEKYNMAEIQTRVLNGDGANWIKATCEDENIHFQLDPFHISQAIVRKVSDKKERKKLLKLFREGKVEEGLQTIVDMMVNTDEDDSRFRKLTELYDYLVHNREGLVPYKLRGDIKLPTPPEGIFYNQLGTMEHNICDVLAQRMKGRKMSWSINGADNLAKILAEKFSGRLFETVDKIYKNILPNELVDEINIKTSLSAAKTKNQSNNVDKIYKIHTCAIPYSETAATLAAKAIKSLCSDRKIEDLNYI